MTRPGISTVKTLFALSCNSCSYKGCEEPLTNPSWSEVKADIAHIRGEKPGAARYDPTMTDGERAAYDNLLLLCPNHHRFVDRLDAEAHPVSLLLDMKQRHESRCDRPWASDQDLTHWAELCVAAMPEGPDEGADAVRLEAVVDADGSQIVVTIQNRTGVAIDRLTLSVQDRGGGNLGRTRPRIELPAHGEVAVGRDLHPSLAQVAYARRVTATWLDTDGRSRSTTAPVRRQ